VLESLGPEFPTQSHRAQELEGCVCKFLSWALSSIHRMRVKRIG
jgi:hypothetical protein